MKVISLKYEICTIITFKIDALKLRNLNLHIDKFPAKIKIAVLSYCYWLSGYLMLVYGVFSCFASFASLSTFGQTDCAGREIFWRNQSYFTIFFPFSQNGADLSVLRATVSHAGGCGHGQRSVHRRHGSIRPFIGVQQHWGWVQGYMPSNSFLASISGFLLLWVK